MELGRSAFASPAPVAIVAQDSPSTAPDATVVGAVAMTTRPSSSSDLTDGKAYLLSVLKNKQT